MEKHMTESVLQRRAALVLGAAALVGDPASISSGRAAEPPAAQVRNVSDHVALIVRFVPKPGKYMDFRDHLSVLIERMSGEPGFVQSIVHDDLDNEGQLVNYEMWTGSKERWMAEQSPKAYRKDFEVRVPELLEKRDVSWLTPIRAWGLEMTKR